MNCPRCKTLLKTDIVKDIHTEFEIDKCESCGGTWFDHGELSKVDKIIEPVFWEIRKIPGEKEQLKALHCPSCNNSPLMQKAEHPRDNKVILDYCPSCKGIWLDKGELEAIQKENWLISIGKIFAWLIGSK
jgi:Zn-finger nucleic acid-binding protein